MNAERLYALSQAILNEFRDTETQKILSGLGLALQNLVNSPGDATYQKDVARHREMLAEAIKQAPSNNYPPSWNQALEELGTSGLLGHRLGERVNEIFVRNAMTPAVAMEEIGAIDTQIENLVDVMSKINSSLSSLGIKPESLAAGESELAVLIPRSFVDNRLDGFAEELRKENQIFGVFSELATGSRPGFGIRSISSSDLSMFLQIENLKIAAAIAQGIAAVIVGYKSILEIRKLHAEMAKLNIPDAGKKYLEDYADSVMEKAIADGVVKLINDFYEKADQGRKNELSIDLQRSMRRLAKRIDQGFHIDVRVGPQAKDENANEENKYRDMVLNASPMLQFKKIEGEPILKLPERVTSRPDSETDSSHAQQTKRPARKRKPQSASDEPKAPPKD